MKKLILLSTIVLTTIVANAQWQQINFGSLYVTCITSDSSLVYVGTALDGVYLSKDCGGTWIQVNNGLPIDMFTAITNLEVIDTNIIACTFNGNTGSIYLSNNQGNSWTEIHNGIPMNSYINDIYIKDNIIFVVTFNNDGSEPGNNAAFYSIDTGSSWINLNASIINTPSNIAKNNNYIFLSFFSGAINRTSNFGTSWTNIQNGSNVYSIETKGSFIFAGNGDGMIRSSDNGTNWTTINNGLTNLLISDIKIIDTTIFAITYSGGIFYSLNNGNLWLPFNDGLNDLAISDVSICDSNVFAGNNEGLWKRASSDITSTSKINQNISELTLFPNPSNGKFIIKGKANSIEITNILGEIIYKSIINNIQSNNEINLSYAPKGIYFVKIYNGKNFHLEKIVLN